jgi:SpoVK/Ycf46/Vps4 family AAA+-type ATPase
MGIMRDLFQISKMAKEMGVDISVDELKSEIFGDSGITDEEIEQLDESNTKETSMTRNSKLQISDDDRTKFSENLLGYEEYTEQEASALYAFDKPLWPVSNVMFAAAGPLASIIKEFLDDMEPLIGLIADEMEHSDDPILDARKVVLASGYLNMSAFIFEIWKYLTSSSFGKRGTSQSEFFFNNNYTYDQQLRNAWLDEYPFVLWDVIGWNSSLNPFDAFNQLNGWEIRNRFVGIFRPINKKYPAVPDAELYESGCSKMVRKLAGLMKLDYNKMKEVCQIQDFFPPIDDWHSFLENSQGFIPATTMDHFDVVINEVEKDWDNPNNVVAARLQVLKAFSFAFQPPYLIQDMDLWRSIAKETYEKAKKSQDYSKAFKALYQEPYETEYGTSLPKLAVFEELVEQIIWAHEGAVNFKDWEEANNFLYALINFEIQIVARHHYPTKKQMGQFTALWETYTDFVNSLILRDLKINEAIESGSFLEKIDLLVGLEGIKTRLKQLAALVQSGTDSKNLPPLQHMVFSGNPGTGKTSVATILGEIFGTLGLLKSGHVISVTRADLVAPYTGQTAPKVNAAVDKAIGGILFIDEAYTLKRDSLGGEQDSFGQEAIDALLTRMENERGSFVVIAAGYPAEMQRFIDSNPGLRSRFSDQWSFDDYNEVELFEMFKNLALGKDVLLDEKIEHEFSKLAAVERQKPNFSNARWQRTLLENAQRRMASRLSGEPTSSKSLLPMDLTDPPKHVEISQKALDQIREKLGNLVGLESVKEDVENLIAFQLVQQRRQAEGLPLLGNGIGHLVFAGPPGTGKTTIARLIGQFYKELGLLESGHCVETQRADLVAGFIGQTAIKTKETINKAMGGILFIDEAYTLIKQNSLGTAEDFGQEAVDTLLKMMEDSKGKFVVVIAGYSDRMQEFLNSNPGMRSRFSKTLDFEPWSAEEFASEMNKLLNEASFSLDEGAKEALKLCSVSIVNYPAFASGRSARTFKEKIIEAQSRRISSDMKASLTTIEAHDINMAASKI